MDSGDTPNLDNLRMRRREREADERVSALAAWIARAPHDAALRLRELEIDLSLAAGSLREAGDHQEAALAEAILADEGGDWGQELR